MCFDPKVDGALLWPSVHILAANADTPEKRAAYVSFAKSLIVMYPCARCRKHTEAFMQEFDIENYASSAQDLLYWTWIYHDSVNRKLHKPIEQFLSWHQVREKYMANCPDEDETSPHSNNSDSSKGRSDKAECIECNLSDEESEKDSEIPQEYSSMSRRKYKPIN